MELSAILSFLNTGEIDAALSNLVGALNGGLASTARTLRNDVQRIDFFERCCLEHAALELQKARVAFMDGRDLEAGAAVRRVGEFLKGWLSIHDDYLDQIDKLTRVKVWDVIIGKHRDPFKDERARVREFVAFHGVNVRGVRF
jgi:hypothetical protein